MAIEGDQRRIDERVNRSRSRISRQRGIIARHIWGARMIGVASEKRRTQDLQRVWQGLGRLDMTP